MTDHEKNLSDQALEEALARMAEEVPPMPADFHDKWVGAVRAEAARHMTEPANEDDRKVIPIIRWTRALSVAAVFVFLIGGTLIYRSSRTKTAVTLPAAENYEAAANTTEEPAQEDAGVYFAMEAAEPEADMSIEAASEAGGAAVDEATEKEMPVLNMSFSGAAKNQASAVMDAEQEEAAEEAEEAPVPAEKPTAAPTQEPAKEEETKPEEKEKQPEEKTGFLQAAGDFFRDMGAFLLSAWPYLLILAIPAGIALVMQKKKKDRN